MINRKIRNFIIACILFLVGCGSAAEDPEIIEPVSIKLGLLPYLSHAPLYIAQQEGFFEEQGLDVELIQFSRSGEMMAPLLQGDLDVVVGSVTPSFLNAISQGGNLKFAANKGFLDPSQDCSVTSYLVRNELFELGNLSDPKNIKGLNITNLDGSLFDYSLGLFLESHGLTKEDIEEVNYPPPPTLMESLGNGAIDIGAMSEPWLSRTIDAGFADILIRLEEIIPNYDLGIIIYGPRLLENVDIGQKFMMGYLNAVEFYSEGKNERNTELIAEFTKLTTEEVANYCWQPISLDGEINVEMILEYEEWAFENGFIDEIIPVEQFWDPQFIEYANQKIR